MAQDNKKQWFQKGYTDEANALATKQGLSFANEKGEGESKTPNDPFRLCQKAAAFKLWAPRDFYLEKPVVDPKAKRTGPPPKTVKRGIFTDDSRIVLRRHTAWVPNKAFANGGSWQQITCPQANGPLKVYENLIEYAGFDDTPGNFPACCGFHFADKTRAGDRIRPGMTDSYVARTIIDPEFVDNKGKTHYFVPKLHLAKGLAQQKLDDLSYEHGGLTGALCSFTRMATEKSNALGDEIAFKKKGDGDSLLALVPKMTYCEQSLADLMTNCWDDPALKDALGEIFQIPETRPETGYWVPVFNYEYLLAPWTEEHLKAVFPTNPKISGFVGGTRTYDVKVDNSKEIPGFEGSDTDGDDDDIPF